MFELRAQKSKGLGAKNPTELCAQRRGKAGRDRTPGSQQARPEGVTWWLLGSTGGGLRLRPASLSLCPSAALGHLHHSHLAVVSDPVWQEDGRICGDLSE